MAFEDVSGLQQDCCFATYDLPHLSERLLVAVLQPSSSSPPPRWRLQLSVMKPRPPPNSLRGEVEPFQSPVSPFLSFQPRSVNDP
jgi:hypothetical protein